MNGNGVIQFVVTKEYENMLIGIAISRKIVYKTLIWNVTTMTIYLVVIMIIIVVLMNWMVNRVVIKGLYHVLDDISEITGGNLDIMVDEHATPEFDKLSLGINHMVETMRYENNHDHLTGLCRYAYFMTRAEMLRKETKSDEVFAVLMMDLDNFKQINDNYGHDAGDKYLARFAAVLKSMDKNHALPCRRSGDEFCMAIYGYHTREEVDLFVEEFKNRVRETRVQMTEETERQISFSGGYRIADGLDEELCTLMKQADDTLYEVKKVGKGNIKSFTCVNQEKVLK